MTPSHDRHVFSTACPACGHPYRVPTSYQGRQLSCKGCGKAFLLEPAPAPPDSRGPSPGPAEVEAAEDACRTLGRLALKHRFLTEGQLKDAFALQQEAQREGRRALLGSLLVRQGLITQKQLDFLLSLQMVMEARKLDRKFGEVAVKNGCVGPQDVEEALQEQERLFKKTRTVRLIGEILVERGKMDPAKRDTILKLQQRLFVDEEETQAPEEPSDPCEDLFEVAVSTDGLKAEVTPGRPVPDSIAVEQLKSFLERRGVTHGLIPDEELEAFLRQDARAGHPFTVARGTPPLPGRDAEIHYHFDTDPLKVGTLKEGGGIDFKDRGEIPQVAEGSLLAERVPPEEGTPGLDVTGREISPPKPRNRKLRKGKGTELSGDGLRLLAALPGRPEISADGKVFVFSEHKIRGDVDLKCGHVDFNGDIQVSGTVQKGFRVRGGSLAANEIAGGEIDVRGDVVVTGGIIGATIRVGGNLRALYVHKSRILAFGDVVLEKEAIDADVETCGAFIVKKGPVFSSRVTAKKGIEAVQVGSKTSNPCQLVVGTDDRVKREIQEIEARIERFREERASLRETIEHLDQEKQETALELGSVAQKQDATNVKKRRIEKRLVQAREEGDEAAIKKLQQALQMLEGEMKAREEQLEAHFAREDTLEDKIQALKQDREDMKAEAEVLAGEIEHLEEWARSEEPVPVIKVFGHIFPYTVIQGRYTSLTLPEGHQGVRIKEIHIQEPEDGKEWKLRLSPLKK